MVMDLIKVINEHRANESEDYTPFTIDLVQQILQRHNRIKSIVNEVKKEDLPFDEQMEKVIDTVNMTTDSKVEEAFEDTYDVIYLNDDVKEGEISECAFSIYVTDKGLKVIDNFHFRTKGDHHLLFCELDSIALTLTNHNG